MAALGDSDRQEAWATAPAATRPSTPPAIKTTIASHSPPTWITPSSPTRPGPPVTRGTPMGNASRSPPVDLSSADKVLTTDRDSDEWVSAIPPSASASSMSTPEIISAPLASHIVNKPELATEQKEAGEVRRRGIKEAMRDEKRRQTRRISQMDDADLNSLIRSSQKLIRSVHIAPPAKGDRPEDELDLNPAEAEEFTLEKLQSHLERFYAGVLFSGIRLVQEIIRIRGWKDGGERTGIALVYIAAWYYGLIFFALFAFISLLVLVPPSRSYCFGPRRTRFDVSADPSIPYSTLSIPDTPQLPWGPAASERQATEWAKQIEDILVSLITPGGKKSKGGEEVIEKAEEKVNGVMVKDMKQRKKSDEDVESMGKKEMAIEVYGKPGMRILGALIDKWERVSNAINPTPPFVKPSRVRVFYTMLLPLVLGSLLITPQLISRACGAGFGFVMFGKPIIDWTIDELDRNIPQWREKIILEYNLLADVPTNPQLVLRLRRDAEHQRRPIPHPSPEKEVAEDNANDDDDDDDDTGDESEDADAMDGEGGEDENAGTKANKGIGGIKRKISVGTRTKVRRTWDKMGELKEEGFALVSGRKKVNYEAKAKATMDKLHISKDSKPASKLLDKLPGVSEDDSPDTPSRFYVNHAKHGPGHLIIYPPTISTPSSDKFTPARISFTTIRNVPTSRTVPLDPDQLDSTSDHLNPHKSVLGSIGKGEDTGDLVISINDIIAMKKTGLGKVASLGVSWALDVDDAGGTGLELEIIRRGDVRGVLQRGTVKESSGDTCEEAVGRTEKIVLKKIVRRDELFDRLLALGEQRWELM